ADMFQTHASILAAKDDWDGAVLFQRKAFERTGGRNMHINRNYIRYLVDGGDKAAPQEGIAELIRLGKETTGMEALLKQAYRSVQGSQKGYEAYLADLRADGVATIRQDIIADWMDEPAPDFDLANLDGNRIPLASLRGKVI